MIEGVVMSRNVKLPAFIATLLLLAIATPSMSGTVEPIYGPDDRIRYEYIFRSENETCVWIIKVTIKDVNATHVSYSAGLEGLVSGGELCEVITSLLVLGLAFESTTPVDLRTTTPESKRVLISPAYTGVYTFNSVTVEYYKRHLYSISRSCYSTNCRHC